jgi:hypothetical protein
MIRCYQICQMFINNITYTAQKFVCRVPFQPTGTNIVTNTAPTPGVRMRVVRKTGSTAGRGTITTSSKSDCVTRQMFFEGFKN